MTMLQGVHRFAERLVLKFSAAESMRTDEYMGGSILVRFSLAGEVTEIVTSRLAAPELQIISDIINRYDLSLDPLVHGEKMLVA